MIIDECGGVCIIICEVMGEILTAVAFLLPPGGWRSGARLETKSTAWHCNYSLGHWLIGKWEMGLKGWGVWTGSCCMTNKHLEEWAIALRLSWQKAIYANVHMLSSRFEIHVEPHEWSVFECCFFPFRSLCLHVNAQTRICKLSGKFWWFSCNIIVTKHIWHMTTLSRLFELSFSKTVLLYHLCETWEMSHFPHSPQISAVLGVNHATLLHSLFLLLFKEQRVANTICLFLEKQTN